MHANQFKGAFSYYVIANEQNLDHPSPFFVLFSFAYKPNEQTKCSFIRHILIKTYFRETNEKSGNYCK